MSRVMIVLIRPEHSMGQSNAKDFFQMKIREDLLKILYPIIFMIGR